MITLLGYEDINIRIESIVPRNYRSILISLVKLYVLQVRDTATEERV